MTKEFKIKKFKDATVYTLESATAGGTSAGSVASVSSPVGSVRRRSDSLIAQEEKKDAPKPRNFVAKNAKMGGAGAHKDKKKDQKQGKEKHKKPYMEDLKDRINTLKSKLDEVSLGDYSKKAKMDQALSAMSNAFGNDQSPEKKAKLQHKISRREIGLGRAKVRTDKKMADYEAQRKAEHEQAIRDKYAGVDIDAEIAKLQPAIERAYHEYQYGARNTYSQGRDDYERLKAKVRELEQAKEIIGGVDEDAPKSLSYPAGAAVGAIAGMGGAIWGSLFGPIGATIAGVYTAYKGATGTVAAVDAIWDWASKKLGGEDNAEQFAKAHIRAAAKGDDSFNFNGKDFPVELKPNEVQPAAKAVKQVSESRSLIQNLEEGWNSVKITEDYVDPEQSFDAIEELVESIALENNVDFETVWEDFDLASDEDLFSLAEDWQKVNKKDKTDGMSRKAVKAYRRENPGSKLKTAVTTKPSKLKKGGKAAKRRKSFCARMSGMKKAHAGAKTKRDPDSPINKALRRWNCESVWEDHSTASKGWGNASYDAYSNTRHGRGVAEKLDPNAPTDVWVQDFQKADPNKYHQFKNKTPQKKAQMAVAAHYAANEPSKK